MPNAAQYKLLHGLHYKVSLQLLLGLKSLFEVAPNNPGNSMYYTSAPRYGPAHMSAACNRTAPHQLMLAIC